MKATTRALLLLSSLFALVAPAQAQTGVSDDRVSLPEGPGSLQGVGENASVNPNMGLFSRQVPLELPRGFAGVSPTLTLSYTSGGGSGPVGIGWSLGLGSIERLTLRGLPKYTEADEFAADGGQQLVRIPNTNPPVYRSRFEGGFVRYTWLVAAASQGREGYWVAEFPDGSKGYYGADESGMPDPGARDTGPQGTFRYHLVARVDHYGHAMRVTYGQFGTTALPIQVGWVHDASGTPHYAATFLYETRPDPISDCKAGFEELLTHRLTRVNVLVDQVLLRHYELAYEDAATSGGFSRLVSVTKVGADGGVHPMQQRFQWSRSLGGACQPNQDCQNPYLMTMGPALGINLAQGDATLVDINGDALPDVVDTSVIGGAHRFFINTLNADGSHSFSAPIDSAVGTHASHDLSSAAVQVLDVDGDGFADLINAQQGKVLMNRGTGDWSEVADLWGADSSGLPSDFVPNDGELKLVRFLDYDGDKRIDVVRSQGAGVANTTTLYRNTGAGFSEDTSVESIGAGFDSDSLELDDMNGDGLQDPVQVLESSVRFKPNLGRGRWSADWTVIGGFSFTPTEAADAELEDLNGDAIADLVLVSGNSVRYWLNRAGQGFDDERVISLDGMPVKDSQTRVLFADMNGNGSSDVVWFSSQGQVTYLELFPERPNLLTRVENGLGLTVTVEYRPSATLMASAGDWAHRLPLPMTVVDRTTEWNTLANVVSETRYTYRDGYYDGVEKSFRGFGNVRVATPGDGSQEAGITRMTYDLGLDDPYRAGLLLSEQHEGSDGRVLSVSSTTYEDCPVAGVPTFAGSGMTFPVRHVCAVASQSELREGVADPSAWVVTESRTTTDGYGQTIKTADLGVVSVGGKGCAPCATGGYTGTPCGEECLGDERYSATDYVTPETNGDRWLLQLPWRVRSYGVADAQGLPATSVVTERRSYYDGEAFVGLAQGQATYGFVSRVTEAVDAAGTTVDLTRQQADAHGNVVEQIRPTGTVGDDGDHRIRHTYDASGLHIMSSEMATRTPEGDAYRLFRDYTWDTLFDTITMAALWRTDTGDGVATASQTFFDYDEFGMLIAMTRPGAFPGMPSAEYSYEYGEPTTRVVTRRRAQAGDDWSVEEITCLDGHGREYQHRSRISEGLYEVSGLNRINAQGRVAMAWEPYLSDSGDCDTEAPAGVGVATLSYDSMGRLIASTLPKGADEAEAPQELTEFGPLVTRNFDAEDSDPGSPYYGTPTVDRMNGLGQVIAVERQATPGGPLITHHVRYDELGRISAVVDPEGVTRTQTHDLRGAVLTSNDPDRGLVTYAYDAAGSQISETSADGVTVRRKYDGLGRLVAEWHDGAEAATRTEWTYDLPGSCPEAACTNVSGRLAHVRYPLGDGSFGEDSFGYNVRGQTVLTSRTLEGHRFDSTFTYDDVGRVVSQTFPTGRELEWSHDGASRVTGYSEFVDSIEYEARGLASKMVFANGVTETRSYNARQQLSHLGLTGPSGALLDTTCTRDLNGRLTEVVDARADDGTPSASARYTYDALYRLIKAELDPSHPAQTETLTVAFDGADRVLSRTSSLGASSPAHVGAYTYGTTTQPHEVHKAGALELTWDITGRLATRGNDAYTWDARGRLTEIVGGDGTESAYGYDGADDRVVRRTAGITDYFLSPVFEVRNGVAVTTLIVDGVPAVRIEEPSFVTSVLSDVAPATGEDSALTPAPDGRITSGDAWLASAAGDGTVAFAGGATPSTLAALQEEDLRRLLHGTDVKVRYEHRNHAGSVALVTDEAGAVTGRTELYPDGQVRYSSGESAARAYTGKEQDATGLIYFGARYLDPVLGRWVSPDPAFDQVEEDSLNRLAEATGSTSFVVGDPINQVDDDGRIANFVVGGLIGAGAAVTATIIERRIEGHKLLAWPTVWAVTWAVARGSVAGALTSGLSAIGEGAGLLVQGGAAARGFGERGQKSANVMGNTVVSAVRGAIAATSGDWLSASGHFASIARQGLDQALIHTKGETSGAIASRKFWAAGPVARTWNSIVDFFKPSRRVARIERAAKHLDSMVEGLKARAAVYHESTAAPDAADDGVFTTIQRRDSTDDDDMDGGGPRRRSSSAGGSGSKRKAK